MRYQYQCSGVAYACTLWIAGKSLHIKMKTPIRQGTCPRHPAENAALQAKASMAMLILCHTSLRTYCVYACLQLRRMIQLRMRCRRRKMRRLQWRHSTGQFSHHELGSRLLQHTAEEDHSPGPCSHELSEYIQICTKSRPHL